MELGFEMHRFFLTYLLGIADQEIEEFQRRVRTKLSHSQTELDLNPNSGRIRGIEWDKEFRVHFFRLFSIETVALERGSSQTG